jgi:hypothetical protein
MQQNRRGYNRPFLQNKVGSKKEKEGKTCLIVSCATFALHLLTDCNLRKEPMGNNEKN